MATDELDWYYTIGLDQFGPVPFEELRAKAAASEIHPRQDMVWNNTMEEWLPAGQIENLFEKRSIDTVSEAAAVSISALQENIPKSVGEVTLWPGASRRWYFLLVLLFPIFWVVLSVTFATFVGPRLAPGFQKIFLLLGLIVPVWVVVDASLTRLSNLGMSKLFFLLNFVPVLNLWLGYRCFACPAGYAKTKKLDPIGWFLAIIYWLFFIGCFAVAILIPTVLATAMKDTDFMKKFEEAREQFEAAVQEQQSPDGQPEESEEPAPAP